MPDTFGGSLSLWKTNGLSIEILHAQSFFPLTWEAPIHFRQSAISAKIGSLR